MATRTTRTRRRRADGEPATRDPEGTRRAILDSALRLFEEEGFHATSVQRIVDEARLTKGAFYHHFESKEEVLHELHDQFIDHQLDRMRTVLARDEPPDVLLRQVMTEVMMEPIGVYRAETTVFLQERRFLSHKAFAAILRKRNEFEHLVIELIERGIASGVFKAAGPPKLLAFGVIGMGAWAYSWLDPKGQVSPREIGEIFGEIVVDGLKAGTGIPAAPALPATAG